MSSSGSPRPLKMAKLNCVSKQDAMRVLELEEISSDFIDEFNRDGCAIVKNFASASECDDMRNEMSKLIDEWDPKSVTTFRTDEKQELAQGSSDYF